MLFRYEEYFKSQMKRFYLLFKDDRKAIAEKFMAEEMQKLKELQDHGRISPKEATESKKYLEKMMTRFIATGDIEG